MNDQAKDFGSGADRLREMMDMKMEIFAAQLRKLGELRDEGLLSDEEFAAAKKELLAKL